MSTKINEEEEVDEYLKKTKVFPCFLISKELGKIETIFDGFEKENLSIQKIKENSFIVTYQESEQDFRMIIDSQYTEDISLFGNPLEFKAKINKKEERQSSQKIFVGEYKLYSFNIKEEDLSFSKYYIEKFQQIAKSNISDEEKSEELENIFKDTGYYIPRKIYIGGMMISRDNQFSRANTDGLDISINSNIDKNSMNNAISGSNNSKFNEIYHSQSTKIIGGDYQAKTFDDWIKSIHLENANIVECGNIIEAKNILGDDLKKQLEKPLKIINEKYSKRKKYLEKMDYLLNLRKEKLCEMKNYGNFNRGFCEEINEISQPKIYMKSFDVVTKTVFFPPIVYENFHYQSNEDIIVGFYIHDNRGDGHNGQWTIKNEPLGSKEITIEFGSGFLREQNFTINVYFMKKPK